MNRLESEWKKRKMNENQADQSSDLLPSPYTRASCYTAVTLYTLAQHTSSLQM